MFKVNIKDTKTTLMAPISHLVLVFLVNFEHVIAVWVRPI